MPEGQLLKCPSCASTVSAAADATEVKCLYCGNTVIAPKEIRPPQVPARAGATRGKLAGLQLRGRIGISLVIVAVVVAGVLVVNSLKGSHQAASTAGPAGNTLPAGFAHEVMSFGGEGTAPGLFQDARHVAVDPRGIIYVDDFRTMRVQRFDATGKHLGGWTVDDNLCTNPSVSLSTVAADGEGHVYVHFCGAILKYDGETGTLLARFSGERNTPRDFYVNMVMHPAGGLLVLADGAPEAHEVLLRLDADGKVRARYPNLVSRLSPKQPANATTLSLAVDGLGYLYLLNMVDYAIYKFTPAGKYVSRFGSVGTGPGQFDAWAQHLATDKQGRVYVTDFSGLKRFDSKGTYLDGMNDRSLVGVLEMRITTKNEIFIVGGSNTVFKLSIDN